MIPLVKQPWVFRPARSISSPAVVAAVAILLAGAAYGVFAQSAAPPPAFQVASIKPNPTPWDDRAKNPMGGGFQPGGRLRMTNSSLLLLIQFAYANHDSNHWLPLMTSQVIGGPSWVNSIGYDIDAKPDAAADPRHMWLMLQTLLADRFQLVLHRETRELPVYILTAAHNGPKLPPAKPAECVSFPPGTPPHYVAGKVDCGYIPLDIGTGIRMHGSRLHMSDLARELAMVLGRPVLDRTGYTAEFDLHLAFNRDASLQGFESPDQLGLPDPTLPDIFGALEEQTGLKLVSGKGPVEVLVIDRAAKPTPN